MTEQDPNLEPEKPVAVPQVTAASFGAKLEEDEQTELEKANQSLVSTLRLGFMILSFIMIVLAIAFMLSGLFMVEKGSVAVKVKFGELVKNDDGRVVLYGPGQVHWAWPSPIEDTVILPAGVFQVDLDKSFWFNENPGDQDKTLDDPSRQAGLTLDPNVDGSLITGDQQIAHLQLKIRYRVNQEDLVQIEHFATNIVTDNRVTTEARASQMVKLAAEKATVRIAGRMDAKTIWRQDKAMLSEMIDLIQNELVLMETGLKIETIEMNNATPPLKTRRAYSRSLQAESFAANVINMERALSQRELTEIAGEAHEALNLVITLYKQAIREEDEALKAAAEVAMSNLYLGVARADQVLSALEPALDKHWLAKLAQADEESAARLKARQEEQMGELKDAAKPVLVGGKVSGIISQARQYKNGYHQQMQREYEQFISWQAQFGDDRKKRLAVMNKLLLEAREKVFENPETEVFRLPSDPNKHLELVMQHDPDLARKFQEMKLKATEEDEERKRAEKFRQMSEE